MNEKLNNVEWSFTQETGCLTITGTGKMQNWAEHQELTLIHNARGRLSYNGSARGAPDR